MVSRAAKGTLAARVLASMKPGELRWTVEPASCLLHKAQHWDELNHHAGELPFLRTAFLLPLLASFGNGDERVAWGFDAAGQLQAAAVLTRASAWHWHTFQPSQLPLGAWLHRPGAELRPCLRSLLRALPGFTLSLGLTQLDPAFTPRVEGPAMSGVDYVDTAWLAVEGDWSSYWESRGKNLKSNLRKIRNRLESEGLALRFSTVTAPSDMARAMEDYVRLEASGWKAEQGTAIDVSNGQSAFYARMLQNFAATGQAELWCLHIGDDLVAMDINLLQGRTLVMLKTAYDTAFKQYSPAYLLKQEGFEREFAQGRTSRIEFYGKVLEWHTRWTDRQRQLYHLNVDRWDWPRRWHQRLKS